MSVIHCCHRHVCKYLSIFSINANTDGGAWLKQPLKGFFIASLNYFKIPHRAPPWPQPEVIHFTVATQRWNLEVQQAALPGCGLVLSVSRRRRRGSVNEQSSRKSPKEPEDEAEPAAAISPQRINVCLLSGPCPWRGGEGPDGCFLM